MNDESTKDLNETEYFEKIVWPLLINRIPVFENLQVCLILYFEVIIVIVHNLVKINFFPQFRYYLPWRITKITILLMELLLSVSTQRIIISILLLDLVIDVRVAF